MNALQFFDFFSQAYGGVAQLVEQGTHKPWVRGSIPLAAIFNSFGMKNTAEESKGAPQMRPLGVSGLWGGWPIRSERSERRAPIPLAAIFALPAKQK